MLTDYKAPNMKQHSTETVALLGTDIRTTHILSSSRTTHVLSSIEAKPPLHMYTCTPNHTASAAHGPFSFTKPHKSSNGTTQCEYAGTALKEPKHMGRSC